jgi:pyruvate dehydrogenase E1 component alpha subunit
MLSKTYDPLKGKKLEILSPEGKVIKPSLMPKVDLASVRKWYETMVFARVADQKAIQYQRQGRMLTYAPSIGQEAASLGAIIPTEERDWLVPAFRELAGWLQKGAPLENLFLYWYGNEAGALLPDSVRMLPISVPIASQLTHAVGLGMAIDYEEKDEVVIAFCGDGGTSQGEFHEALNFAGVFESPVVFVIQNNQFAISVSRKDQTRSKTLAQKAIAYGIPGIQVDGNDLFAMIAATQEAVARARAGDGPTLIEAVTYRLGPHTTSDDPSIYRSDEEVEMWKEKDPILRLKRYLISKKNLSEEEDQSLYKQFEEEVNATFSRVEESESPTLDDVFSYTYASLTPTLEKQLKSAKQFLEGGE